ncbi:MAG: hypothetical protein AMJ90_06875 [candidate division Zixibacteria bacterium SM23_73_2]|nr:MAG: hypothetical protein AMJ90_06875 [candidate division Zixibacteria bacterium SM23_73_2]
MKSNLKWKERFRNISILAIIVFLVNFSIYNFILLINLYQILLVVFISLPIYYYIMYWIRKGEPINHD